LELFGDLELIWRSGDLGNWRFGELEILELEIRGTGDLVGQSPNRQNQQISKSPDLQISKFSEASVPPFGKTFFLPLVPL
jgi:hypothetical protein